MGEGHRFIMNNKGYHVDFDGNKKVESHEKAFARLFDFDNDGKLNREELRRAKLAWKLARAEFAPKTAAAAAYDAYGMGEYYQYDDEAYGDYDDADYYYDDDVIDDDAYAAQSYDDEYQQSYYADDASYDDSANAAAY